MQLSPQLLDGVAAHLPLRALGALSSVAPRVAAPHLRAVADRIKLADADHEHRCFAVRYWRIPERMRVALALPRPDDPPPKPAPEASVEEWDPGILARAAIVGNLEEIQTWAVGYRGASSTLLLAAENGHFHICQWLVDTHLQSGGVVQQDLDYLCLVAARNGCCRAMAWVLPLVSASAVKVGALGDALKNKHRAVARQLLRALKSDCRDGGWDALTCAALLHGLPMCRWVISNYQLGATNTDAAVQAVGAAALVSDQRTVMFLVRHFQLHGVDVLEREAYRVASGGHVSVCRWLASHTACSGKSAGEFLQAALQHRSLGACVWAVEQWHMARSDIVRMRLGPHWTEWLSQFCNK